MKRLVCVVFLSASLSLPALAQANEFRRYEINWNIYSFERHIHTGYHGGSLSFAFHPSNHWALVADAGVHETLELVSFSGNTSDELTTYRFGPRYSLRHGKRFSPFGQVLAGGARTTNKRTFSSISSTTTTSIASNGFSFAAGGGFDFGIRPWFAFRPLQAEYSFVRFSELDINSSGVRVGGGLVFRFGK